MGLDTYAAPFPEGELIEEDEAAFEQAGLDGGYIRGKLFSELVKCVTGVSLYQEWIPPETVQKMADAFKQCDPEEAIREHERVGWVEHGPEAVEELARFFRVCAERRLGLEGSW